jgi:hypothetical protein
MIGRFATVALAGAVALLGPVGAAIAASDEGPGDPVAQKVLFRREQDRDDDALTPGSDEDDDTGDTGTHGDTASHSDPSTNGDTDTQGGTSSHDATGSGHSAVTHDRDQSHGDLTRDRTHDGPGPSTRDDSQHQTNDASHHDTR